ncbi:MAG TPA: (2Fe-2S)-binding protein, partial [Bacteroidales bacterium]|nr:(2Fe-2S)-binding protein [Bacteroidales bacterium]
MGRSYDYDAFLNLSKEYIDSQQHPTRVIEEPWLPVGERMMEKPFVLIDCLYGFACNPCEFACPHGAITKTSTSTVPALDFEKCIGCMECVYQCPGLAIFGYSLKKDWVFLPIEYEAEEGAEVFLVDNQGRKLGEGVIARILRKPNKTNIARVQATDISGEALVNVRGFIVKDDYPEPLVFGPVEEEIESEAYICHCDDVTLKEILDVVGDRKYISVDEIKHTTRLGMGACRGKRCIPRLKQLVRPLGISIVGEATPRGPLSNQIGMAEVFPRQHSDRYITAIHHMKLHHREVGVFIAGGGIGGSALYRYFAEAGENPVLVNYGRGASWRNIAGGRTAFSLPEIAEIARRNHQIFRDLQVMRNIDYRPINYINFAHDEATLHALEASRAWSDAYMVEPRDFRKEISPFMNP